MYTTAYSGIDCVGEIPWGSHFCQFYKTQHDLIDSLVPYFKAGLDNNEKCLWVTAEPLLAADARSALLSAVPDLAEREKQGQIEILNHTDWYLRAGNLSTDAVLKGWVENQEKALQSGYTGLRLTGNTFWIERKDWEPFAEYESKVTEHFKPHRIIGLCSYCLERCHTEGMLDVVRNHEFAVVRRSGDWEVIESASLRQAKAELKKLNHELEQRVKERTLQLEKMVSLRDDFLSVASHELKTPIASLKLYVETMLRMQARSGISPEEMRKRLLKANEQCDRLDTLVSKLLDVSRAGQGKVPVHIEAVDLTELVKDLAERCMDQAFAAGCILEVEAESPVSGNWDRMRIEQVVTNLLSNAFKYAPNSRVLVKVGQSENGAVLEVADSGPGIAKEDQTRIFERFTQLKSPQRVGGFGLGLWIVNEIVQALQGSISVSSKVGEGAKFRIELPASPKDLN